MPGKWIVYILSVVLLFGCSQEQVVNEVDTGTGKDAQWEMVRNPGSDIETHDLVVLELFTSEGCSDCPASDDALSLLIKEVWKSEKNIIPVAFHIDYWNDLVDGEGDCEGKWIDIYSSGNNSFRQFAYCRVMDARPATPQLMINGAEYVYDPDKGMMDSLIAGYTGQVPLYGLDLSLNKENSDFANRRIAVDFSFAKQKEVPDKFRKDIAAQLQVLLVERGLESKPDKGENCGNTLRHNNVVRAVTAKTLRAVRKGTVIIEYPEDADLSDCSVTGYIQDLKNMQIIGGTKGFDLKKVQ